MLHWLLKGRLLYFPPEKTAGALIGAGALNGANTVSTFIPVKIQIPHSYNNVGSTTVKESK